MTTRYDDILSGHVSDIWKLRAEFCWNDRSVGSWVSSEVRPHQGWSTEPRKHGDFSPSWRFVPHPGAQSSCCDGQPAIAGIRPSGNGRSSGRVGCFLGFRAQSADVSDLFAAPLLGPNTHEITRWSSRLSEKKWCWKLGGKPTTCPGV